MYDPVIKYSKDCSNDYLGLTLTFLTARSSMENANSKKFMESFEDFGLKIGIYSRLLNDYE